MTVRYGYGRPFGRVVVRIEDPTRIELKGYPWPESRCVRGSDRRRPRPDRPVAPTEKASHS